MQDIHCVNLLQRATIAFAKEEVDDNCAEEIACCEDIAILVVDGVCDEGCEEADEEVQNPVARCCHAHSLCTISCWEEFACDGPDDGSPSCCISDDEEACEDDHSLASLRSRGWVRLIKSEVAHGCEYHEAHELPETASNEGSASAKVLNDIQAWERHDKVDARQDHCGDVAVAYAD